MYKFEGWKSITLSQFIELQKGIDKEDDELVLHLCSVLFEQPIELVSKSYKWADLTDFASKVISTLENIPNKVKAQDITLHGNRYSPPDFVTMLNGDWWSNSTYGQIQSVMSTVGAIEANEGKDYSGLPLMFAALFQKKGEELTDEIIIKREKLFAEMTMDQVWGAFFLLRKWHRNTQKGIKLSLLISLLLAKWQSWIIKLKLNFRLNKRS